MKIVLLFLLLLAAHFNLTPFAPGKAGQPRIYWPFAADSRPWLPWSNGLLAPLTSIVTPFLAATAGIAFLAAAASLWGWVVPAGWFRVLVMVATCASTLLYVLYIGPFAVLPLTLDILLFWGLLARYWDIAIPRA